MRQLLAKFGINLPPSPATPPPHDLNSNALKALAAALLVTVLTHFVIAHTLIAGYGILIWTLKSLSVFLSRKNPPKALITLMTILSFVLTLLLYGGWSGQKAGISFLVLLVNLKFLESQTLRDYYLVCLILFLLSACSFLFYSDLLSIMLVMTYMVVVLSLMFWLSKPDSAGGLADFKHAATVVLKALPLAILLFFFFPRIQGDFGFIPSLDERSASELSNSLVAGDFANSAFNQAIVFQAEFDSTLPANQQLYWRVKVMEDEQDFSWVVSYTENTLPVRNIRLPFSINENALSIIDYLITHQPSSDSHLPYLDYAFNPQHGRQLNNYAVYRSQRESGAFGYRGAASLQPHLADDAPDVKRLTQTTSRPTARLQRLINQLRNNTSSDRQIVANAIGFFANSPFVYSLTPPSLNGNAIDSFIFETQTGYCEHYASAFTILMRWLGIPARVVVGYQGGDYNEVGNYLEVRYNNAHAWSEVYFDKQWHRVDPTATISPERIEFGIEALLSSWDGVRFNGSSSALSDYVNPGQFQQAWNRLKHGWENLGYQWEKWIINYDFQAQKSLLLRLGLESYRQVYVLLAILLTGIFLLMGIYLWQSRPETPRYSKEIKAYHEFLKKLARNELHKHPAETPRELAERAVKRFPAQAESIHAITDHYEVLRYGRSTGKKEDFIARVKAFKITS